MNAQGIDTDIQTIEPMLEELIREHGLNAVNANLATLFGKSKWADWQRVSNLAHGIAQRLEPR